MRADSNERSEATKTSDADRALDFSHLSSFHTPEGRTPALRNTERALNSTLDNALDSTLTKQTKQMNPFANAKDPSGLPKLEIHLDDKLNYFAEHSLFIDNGRRIAYDFEHSPQIAKAYWGGAAVTMATAVVGLCLLKNPTALAYLARTGAGNGAEALTFGAVGGMAGGSAMQSWYTAIQLRDQLPSSRLTEFKAVRMHVE